MHFSPRRGFSGFIDQGEYLARRAQAGEEATEFYRQNREAMDAGAIVLTNWHCQKY
jgi:hypothetical protein